MKNTNADWVSLIKSRQRFDLTGGNIETYLVDTLNAINASTLVDESAEIFMENIGHVLPFRILQSFSTTEVNRLFNKHDFENVIKLFFSQYHQLALDYTKTKRISAIQYAVFQKFLLFKSVEESVDIDKKRFLLTLKRSKNRKDD